jgi:DNA (cytosine-5)-methyltransferase 1
MRLLDLFCGAGGAAMGYHRAGFEVVGVDINPQPHYPFEFHQADALTYPLEGFDAYHASPPCQRYSTMTPKSHKENHADLLPIVTKIFRGSGKLYCIENVAGARRYLNAPIMLCGSMFGLPTFRHRLFELPNFIPFMILTPSCKHVLVTTAGKNSCAARPLQKGVKRKSVKYAPVAYDIDWMNFQELREAIPPAYTEYIGKYLMETVLGYRQEVMELGI